MVSFIGGKIAVPGEAGLVAESELVRPVLGAQLYERLIRKKIEPVGKPDSEQRQTNQEQNTFVSNLLLFISRCIHAWP
jgi:hypothetical protein